MGWTRWTGWTVTESSPVHMDRTGLKILTVFLGLDWVDEFFVGLDGLNVYLNHRGWTGVGSIASLESISHFIASKKLLS